MSGIDLKNKDFIESLRLFEDDRKIDPDFIMEVLKEAIAKAYQRDMDAPEAKIRVEINPKEMKIYHDYDVVSDDSEDFDDTLDIRLSDAKKLDPEAQVGSSIAEEVDFHEIGRSSVMIAKNMLKQRIKEFEKQRVYDEYKDKVYDLVGGIIKTVEEKFVLVDLKNTIGILLRSEQIPLERYREGQQIRCVIKEVAKNSKGSQVILSRADAMFVKRLLEKEVPEISQGVVEIRAIAREAGERTKVAVYSKSEEIDPIGACIGPRGTRIQSIIQEIKGEKIDIFLWNDNIGELVKNALSPAEVKACFYADEDLEGLSEEEIAKRLKRPNRPLVAVVSDDELSKAIGKRGKNAKLAVKLTNRKIDIKTQSDIAEMGIDVEAKVLEFEEDQVRIKKEKEEEVFKKQQEEALKRKAEFDEKLANEGDLFEDALDEMAQSDKDEEVEVISLEDKALNKEEEPSSEAILEEKEEDKKIEEDEKETSAMQEENKEPAKEEATSKPKRTREVKSDYVSKFEDFASASKKEEEAKPTRRRKKKEDDNRRLRASELRHDQDSDLKIEYSLEELEEIKAQEEEEEANSWINDDIDFDEYDDYYDKD